AEIHPLNAVLGDPGVTQEMIDQQIIIEDLLSGPPSFYYFFLQSPQLLNVSGLCGRLPIFPLLLSAMDRKPHQTNHVLVLHDDFAAAASTAVAHVIAEMREFQISWIFNYQYIGQLTERDAHLDDTVIGCCNWCIACDMPNDHTFDAIQMRLGTRPH